MSLPHHPICEAYLKYKLLSLPKNHPKLSGLK